MYLLDTNIWLERLLGQPNSAVVGELLDTVPIAELLMSDFTLHSLGIILPNVGARSVFPLFVQDVLIDGGVQLVRLSPFAMEHVVAIMDRFNLDFDDAYQYVVAEREEAVLISFDKDFERTDLVWQTPAQILATFN